MSDNPNKTYYQRVYRQLHASEQFKERLITMNHTPNHTQTKKHPRSSAYKAAAAAVILAAALPTGAYAANHYWGITDFFKQSGKELPKEAGHLIETDLTQTPKPSDTNGASDTISTPVTFTVREALCDSGTVNIVIEAKAAESGKYLLVPDDCTTETDSVETLGIHEDISIGDYARSKCLEILYISSGFAPDSPFFPGACHISAKSIQDDTLSVFISADREASDTDLNAVLSHTIRPASGTETITASSSFLLADKSTSRTARYRPKTSGDIPGTNAAVQSVTIEQTEVFTYVDIYYQNAQAVPGDGGLYFSVSDGSGTEWEERSGRGTLQLADGTYCLRLCYDKMEFPETCFLNVFDGFGESVYGEIELERGIGE